MKIGMRVIAMMGAALVSPLAALADVPSLIARMHRGDELRYTYTLTTDETISLTGRTGLDAVPVRAVSNQAIGVVFRVTADTTAMNIVEATFETVKVGMEVEGLKFDVDVNAAAPDEKATQASRDVYGWFKPLVGVKLTLNVAPGSGEITTVQGGEDALKAAGTGAGHLRRFLDAELFRATFAGVFQLKSNSSMPPPGEKWYVKTHVYARASKAPVWETRSVEVVEGDIATVKGLTHASAKPEDSAKAKVFFKSVEAATTYTWDTLRGRMTKAQGSQTIGTRFDRAGGASGVDGALMQDSDLACRWTLEMVEPAKTVTHPTPKLAEKPSEPAAAEPKKGP
jgi:hypothetical protein